LRDGIGESEMWIALRRRTRCLNEQHCEEDERMRETIHG
jgi:hypothetical protein